MGWKLKVQAVANGRIRKADLIVLGLDGRPTGATARGDLYDLSERDKVVRHLARQMPDVAKEEIAEQVEQAWTESLKDDHQQRAALQAAALEAAASEAVPDPEPDPEAEGLELLKATPVGLVTEAQALLRDPDLVDRVTDDVELQGVAGEKDLVATLYLVMTSRKLRRPLAARVRGPSTSGKSHMIDCTATLIPPEAVIRATQLSPMALFYMPKGTLRHKLIVAGERSRAEEDEAAEATRALREMISSGRLSKLLPMKTGEALETVLVEQEGPIAYVESTTLSEVFAEDENRALPLYTDEQPEQTRRILDAMAASYAGKPVSGRDPERARQIHHAAQRLLERCEVIAPFAPRLAAALPPERVEVRRAFPAILSTIQSCALLHQFQRKRDAGGRVIATRADYEIACVLLEGAMRRLLGGTISEPVRRFAGRLAGWFALAEFTTRDAKAKETTSRTSVYGWLAELRTAGLVEQLDAPKGSRPATWKLSAAQAQAADRKVLPESSELFGRR